APARRRRARGPASGLVRARRRARAGGPGSRRRCGRWSSARGPRPPAPCPGRRGRWCCSACTGRSWVSPC
ncbi:MAG: hypothetical protein AVDCRST_MAG68-4970, partial [uncultured Gemmatimonadetes bacterium]